MRIDNTQTWSVVQLNKVICKISAQYVKACKRKVWNTESGVEINTGPLARGQWISCWASRICFALARLASKMLKSYFLVYMVYC